MPPHRKIELLDGDTLSGGEVDAALADLTRSHRLLFGYHAVGRALLPRLAGRRGAVSIVDLGAGSGDVGHRLVKLLARRRVTASIVGVDRKLAHLLAGRRRGDTQRWVVADLEALPFRDDAFDWAYSHLVLHHFDDDANRKILTAMLRVARRAAVIDLARSRLARWIVPRALGAIGTGAVALADGVVSIDQASTLAEVRALVGSFHVVELRRRFPFRFSLILERDTDGSLSAAHDR